MYARREKGENEKQGEYVEMKMDKERKVRRNEKHNSLTKIKIVFGGRSAY